MPGWTQAQLDAEIQARGGEIGGPGNGRRQLPGKPIKVPYLDANGNPLPGGQTYDAPGPPQWIIQTQHGDITVEPDPGGSTYTPVTVPNAPADPGPKADIISIPGRGVGRIVDNTWVPLTGGEAVPTAPTGSWQNGVYYGPPGAPVPQAIASDPLALEDRRIAAATAQATAARAQEAERRANLQMQMNAIKMAQDANEIDAKRAQELRDYLYKTEVEAPQKLREQEDVLKGNALTYGQTAGTQAVSDVTSMLPYRYSPGFMERRQQSIEAIGNGDYRPQTIARGYTGPDLTGTRQAAAAQGQGQYLNTFGFDPMPIANQIAYRPPVAPQPGAVAPQAPSGDDEEFLKRIARELAGTGGNK